MIMVMTRLRRARNVAGLSMIDEEGPVAEMDGVPCPA